MAVLVGCNYPHTKNELNGCINDVLAMREVLNKRFGLDRSQIELLTDAHGSPVMPTGTNIKAALDRMVDRADSGDVLFFHYSGNGTRIPSVRPFNLLRQDEAIVPCDFNLITDVDFLQLVNRLPKGASFTILSDSCHSGGLIDQERKQIGPSSVETDESSVFHSHESHHYKPKVIPCEPILRKLASMTRINTSDIGTHLLEFFGSDASLRFRLPQIELDLFGKLQPDEGILLSGYQANETSADMSPGERGGKADGAFSYAVERVLKENPGPLSNKQLAMMARKVLKGGTLRNILVFTAMMRMLMLLSCANPGPKTK